MKNKLLPLLLLASTMTLSGCSLISNNLGKDSSSEATSESTSSSSSSGSSSSSSSSSSGSTNTGGGHSTSGNTSTSGGSQTTQEVADYTIMVYLCGSNLESYDSRYQEYGSMATDNLLEMLSVNLPSKFNLIIETGGANSWNNAKLGYTINANKLGRWHISNKTLVKDTELSYASMGSSSTFQSFIEWGLKSYPAEKTGVIMWDHGGAMMGCCQDEKKSGDMLTPTEMKTALKNAFQSTSRSQKLEWIGYDCCLMSVADIAYYNSSYFNYMITSQESEPGAGWDYDSWLSSFSTSASTYTNLSAIVDSYVSKCKTEYEAWGDEYEEFANELGSGTDGYGHDASYYLDYANYYRDFNDATLSVLDLSKMEAYKTAWEGVATNLSSKVNSTSKWSTFCTDVLETSLRFGQDSDDEGYYYDVFDVKDVAEKISSKYSIDTSSFQTALNDVVVYNNYGKTYTDNSEDPCGLCAYVVDAYTKQISSKAAAAFPNWYTLMTSY